MSVIFQSNRKHSSKCGSYKPPRCWDNDMCFFAWFRRGYTVVQKMIASWEYWNYCKSKNSNVDLWWYSSYLYSSGHLKFKWKCAQLMFHYIRTDLWKNRAPFLKVVGFKIEYHFLPRVSAVKYWAWNSSDRTVLKQIHRQCVPSDYLPSD